MSMKRIKVLLMLALPVLGCSQCESRPCALVARPETQAWPAPSFRGKPFWPLFAKLSHNPETGGTDSSAGGLDDLPLTQEYASCLNTHNYRAGVAKYR